MIVIHIPEQELWNENESRFIHVNASDIKLEHSLYSIAEWESKWNKSFFLKEEKTEEETMDYIKKMVLNDVDPNVFYCINRDILKQIYDYINAPMTATKIRSNGQNANKPSSTYITSEIIYYWMVNLNIPLECETWHINRLITLIRVCQIKSQPQKKLSNQETIARYAKLNAERRAALKSKG